MLERYYVRPDTVDRVRSSWVGESIEKYVAWLSERRYSWRSVSRRIPILIRFGQFARDRGVSELGCLPDHVEPFVQEWVRERVGRKAPLARRKEVSKSVRGPIQQMLRLVVPGYVGLARARKAENPFQKQAPGFFAHVRPVFDSWLAFSGVGCRKSPCFWACRVFPGKGVVPQYAYSVHLWLDGA